MRNILYSPLKIAHKTGIIIWAFLRHISPIGLPKGKAPWSTQSLSNHLLMEIVKRNLAISGVNGNFELPVHQSESMVRRVKDHDQHITIIIPNHCQSCCIFSFIFCYI